MANITRLDPLEDLFRGFFVRPVDLNTNTQQPPSIKMDVKEQGGDYLVHAELLKRKNIRLLFLVWKCHTSTLSAAMLHHNHG